MKKSLFVAVGVVSLLGLGACSSDSNSLSVKESNAGGTATSVAGSATDETATDSGTDGSDASAGTIPDLSGVPGLAGECSTYLSAFAGAISGQDGDLGSLSSLFDSLDGKVPADLQSAVKVLSKDFAKLQTLYAKYDNDFSKAASDPAFATLFSNSEFTEASAKFNAWISAGCPTD